MTGRTRIASVIITVLAIALAVRYAPRALFVLRATRTLLAVDFGSPFQTTRNPSP